MTTSNGHNTSLKPGPNAAPSGQGNWRTKGARTDISIFLEEVVYPNLYDHLESAYPEFGFRSSGNGSKVGTIYPTSVPVPVNEKRPDRIVCYRKTCFQYMVHGHRAVRWLDHENGGRKPTGDEFLPAVRALCLKAGVAFPERQMTAKQREQAARWEARRTVMTVVLKYCQILLWDEKTGKPARDYLYSRGFTDEDIKDLGFGYYRASKHLREQLGKLGYDVEAAQDAALLWTKLQGYIIIPWMDASGGVLTLYGRWPGPPPMMKDQTFAWQKTRDERLAAWQAKSPEDRDAEPWAEPYLPKTIALPGDGSKGVPLYFDRARRAGHRDTLVAVEGVLDGAIAQCRGDSRTVAYVAAEFSGRQIETLARHNIKAVIIAPDPDGGGDTGACSSVKGLMARGITAYVARRLPDGLDPDEFILRDGIDAWRKHLEDPIPGAVYLVGQVLGAITPEDPEIKRRAAADAAIVEAREVPDERDRTAAYTLISERTGYAAEDLKARGDGLFSTAEPTLDVEAIRETAKKYAEANDLAGLLRDTDFLGRLARLKSENAAEFTLMRTELKVIKGFRYQDFDKFIKSLARTNARERLAEADAAGEERGLPTILCGGEELPVMTDAALAALRVYNDPPRLFACGSELVRLRRDYDSKPAREILGIPALRGEVARSASWQRERCVGEDIIREGTPPPLEVISDIASLPTWDSDIFPPLDSIIDCPRFDRDGNLIMTPGYNPDSHIWYEPNPGLDIPAVPDRPSPEDVRRAKYWLMTELFGDFPFEDDASRANALVATLAPFVRPMILGPTMPHDIEASTPGTGKGLLADAITVPAMGKKPSPNTETKNDEEWDKRITSILLRDPTYVLWDNINRNLDSGVLASVFTAYPTYGARILGQSKHVELPVRCIWLVTANNPSMSIELARRFALTRLKAETEQPWLRKDFTHPNLISWAMKNRANLVWACLVLCRAWIVKDKPRGITTVGSFEEWAEVMGGILAVAEVPGFLENRSKLFEQANDDIHTWRAFVLHWWGKYKEETVTSADLFTLASEKGLLTGILDCKTEAGNKNKLGRELNKKKDVYISDNRITKCDPDHKGTAQFKLTPLPTTTAEREQVKL